VARLGRAGTAREKCLRAVPVAGLARWDRTASFRFAMSAVEVIAIIDTLPPAEQQRVREYLEKKNPATGGDGVRRMDLDKAKAIGEGIFNRHDELFRKLAQ
jgi:hypothetical protein